MRLSALQLEQYGQKRGEKAMQKLYYQPEGFWFGDCMPFGKDGVFYLFHLRDTRNPRPFGEPFGWSLATTKDFVDYTDFQDVIERGSDDDPDQFLYSGSIFEDKDGLYHAFYTGHNRNYLAQGKPSQVLMHATSPDLKKWTKQTGSLAIAAQPGYDKDDWRDPFVIYDEKKERYLLLLGARKINGKKLINGCTVQFFSRDLKEWEFGGQFWAPELFTMHEMPDLFKMGDWWYHIISEYSDRNVVLYRMSRSIDGPWIAPADDAFDGRAYYAARTFALDGERILFGWVPTKEDCDDKKNYEWAGTFVPHRIVQRQDGSLGCLPVSGILGAFADLKPIKAQRISAENRATEAVLADATGDIFKFECDLEGEARSAKISLYENAETGEAYSFCLSMNEGRIFFEKTPNQPWFQCMNIGLERPFRFGKGEKHHLILIVDGTIATLYLDDTALNARFYGKFGDALSMSVIDGDVSITNAAISSTLKR